MPGHKHYRCVFLFVQRVILGRPILAKQLWVLLEVPHYIVKVLNKIPVGQNFPYFFFFLATAVDILAVTDCRYILKIALNKKIANNFS